MIERISIVALAVVAAFAYIKWATVPVMIAYRVGRSVEQFLAFKKAMRWPDEQ